MQLLDNVKLPEYVDVILTNSTYKMMIIIATVFVAAVVIFSGNGDSNNESVSSVISNIHSGIGAWIMSMFFLTDGGKTLTTVKDSSQLFGDTSSTDVHVELAPF